MPVLVDGEKLDMVRAALSPDRFRQMIDAYESSGRDLVLQIQAAFEKGDLEMLQLAAHTLRSATGVLGIDSIAMQAEDLETRAVTGLWPTPQEIHALTVRFHQSLADLRLVCPQPTSNPTLG